MHSILLQKTIEALAESRYPEMDERTKCRLEKIITPVEIHKGDVIIKDKITVNDIFLVGKGLVRQYYIKNNREVTEHFSYEGCVFMSIESMLKKSPNNLIAEALEPCVIFKISYQKLLEELETDMGLNVLYRRIIEHSLIASQKKAYTWRYNTASQRYNSLIEEHPEVIKRAPLHLIASYLNMTPETLSRVRSGVMK